MATKVAVAVHELSITRSVVDAVLERTGGRRVTPVRLQVGALSGVVADVVGRGGVRQPMSDKPAEHLDEAPQAERGEPGSRDTGSDEPAGGPVDRPAGASDEETDTSVDALPGDGRHGSISVLQVQQEDLGEGQFDAHGMDPVAMLASLSSLGGELPYVVGYRPADVSEGIGLSPLVAAAVDEAVTTVCTLINERLTAFAHAGRAN